MMDDQSGAFLRLGRGFFDHWLWQEKRVFSKAEAWLDLVQSSAYQPQKRMISGEVIEVPRGGIVASERFLSDRWMWSRTKVRAFLDLLVSDKMIIPDKDRQKNHRITVFILWNFEKYNPQKDHQKNREPYRRPDQPETTGEPPADQIQEGEESKKSVEHGRELPTWERVRDYARNIGLAEWKARDWFDEMEACGWLDHLHRPIRSWSASIGRVKTKWEADGRPAGPTAAKTGKIPQQSRFAFGKPEYDDRGRMTRNARGQAVDPETGKVILHSEL